MLRRKSSIRFVSLICGPDVQELHMSLVLLTVYKNSCLLRLHDIHDVTTILNGCHLVMLYVHYITN